MLWLTVGVLGYGILGTLVDGEYLLIFGLLIAAFIFMLSLLDVAVTLALRGYQRLFFLMLPRQPSLEKEPHDART